MNISEIKATALKKSLGAKSATYRYKNKNTRGGNFAFEIRGLACGDLELSGDYDVNGECVSLRIGEIYSWGFPWCPSKSIDELIAFIKKINIIP